MPIAPARPCKEQRCPGLTQLPHGYCIAHAHRAMRPVVAQSKVHAGNYSKWRRIRVQVLIEAGIPPKQHHLYDVDHTPAYNPAVEPDHLKYRLTPMLNPDHSRKTATHDGGYGNKKVHA